MRSSTPYSPTQRSTQGLTERATPSLDETASDHAVGEQTHLGRPTQLQRALYE
jgi:hypothetical protein